MVIIEVLSADLVRDAVGVVQVARSSWEPWVLSVRT